jgi:transcriptional regulator with XRE-family HTH domain
MTSETIGGRIREARLRKGMAQADLASAVGVRQLAISQLENDRVGDPKASTLLAMADVLGVSVDWLLRGHELSRSEPPRPPYEALSRFLGTEMGRGVNDGEREMLAGIHLPNEQEPEEHFFLQVLLAYRLSHRDPPSKVASRPRRL